MSNDLTDTKSKIFQAAIDIVGLKGEVTIKEISEKAGVNIAAINYHFGNKNNLLREVENHYTDLLYKIQHEILVNEELPPSKKLIQWAKGVVDFMFKYPALLALIVNIVSEDKNYNPAIIKNIYLNSEMQVSVKNIIRESTGINEEKLLNYKYMQIFSGILGPVINKAVSSIYSEGKGIMDIDNSDELNEYITILVNSILKG
ncbi:MAG: transcriptional regulator, TetR family [Clostridiales bacterium]|jgi:hypothetical protein|nr:transcriptional regulator, TetR family [Clostridiales bacterium]